MDVIIWHDPACGTLRDALALIRHAGIEPTVIAYLKTPPSREEVLDLVARMGMSLADVLREKGTLFAELGLGDPQTTDADRLDAIAAPPILPDRSIVATPMGVKLRRSSGVMLDLLPDAPLPDFVGDDGEPALRDRPVAGGDPGLVAALAEPGRRFFAFSTLSGRSVGYAGFETHGVDVLLRSLVVLPDARGQGFGAAILPANSAAPGPRPPPSPIGSPRRASPASIAPKHRRPSSQPVSAVALPRLRCVAHPPDTPLMPAG